MSVMVSVTLPISSAALPSSTTLSDASIAFETASSVIVRAFSELFATSLMVAVICSAEVATIFRLFVPCSSADVITVKFVFISSAAPATVFDFSDISSAPSDILFEKLERSSDEWFRISVWPAISPIKSLSLPVNVLNHLARSPTSSSLLTSSLTVRSPSPSAISFSPATTRLIGLTNELAKNHVTGITPITQIMVISKSHPSISFIFFCVSFFDKRMLNIPIFENSSDTGRSPSKKSSPEMVISLLMVFVLSIPCFFAPSNTTSLSIPVSLYEGRMPALSSPPTNRFTQHPVDLEISATKSVST